MLPRILIRNSTPIASIESALARKNAMEAIVAPREESIRVGILGKYASLRDAYASIEKSIEHASTHLAVRPELEWVDVSEHEPDSSDIGAERCPRRVSFLILI